MRADKDLRARRTGAAVAEHHRNGSSAQTNLPHFLAEIEVSFCQKSVFVTKTRLGADSKELYFL